MTDEYNGAEDSRRGYEVAIAELRRRLLEKRARESGEKFPTTKENGEKSNKT